LIDIVLSANLSIFTRRTYDIKKQVPKNLRGVKKFHMPKKSIIF